MKKLFIKTFAVFAFLMAVCTVFVFAQADSTGTGTGGGTTDPLALIFGSVLTLSAVILPVTGYLNTHLVKVNSQYFSWIIGLALASLGHVFNLGVFGTYDWFWTLGYGFITALSANGFADIAFVKSILEAIYAKVPKKA